MDKVRKYILPVLFFVLPFAIISRGYLHEGKEGFIHAGQIFSFTLFVLIIIAAQIKNIPLAALLVYAALWQGAIFIKSMAGPVDPQSIIDGLNTIIFLIIGGSLYLAIVNSKTETRMFYDVICLSAIAQLIVGYLQWTLGFDLVRSAFGLFVDARTKLSPSTPTGILGNPNYLAAYLAFSTFFFCRGFKLRWHGFRGFKLPYSPFRWWVTLPFIAVMLYATQTSTAVIALGAGAFVYWFVLLKRGVITRKAFWGTSAAGLAVVIWYAFFYHSIIRPIGNQGGDLQRLDMWISVWQDMTSSWQHFVFGFGPGAPWARPYTLHSEWVTVARQLGLFGIVLMAGYAFTIFRHGLDTPPALLASAVVIFVNMMGNSALHFALSAFLIIIVLGLIEREGGRVVADTTPEKGYRPRPGIK